MIYELSAWAHSKHLVAFPVLIRDAAGTQAVSRGEVEMA